jgi:hypothetical protein
MSTKIKKSNNISSKSPVISAKQSISKKIKKDTSDVSDSETENLDNSSDNNSEYESEYESENESESEYVSNEKNNSSKFKKVYDQLIETRNNINKLQKIEKKLVKNLSHVYDLDIKKANKHKRKINPKLTGFAAANKSVNGKLAEWLHVNKGTVMSTPQIAKQFWARIKEEGLVSDENGKVFRTNKEISDIFGVNKKVNDSNDPKDKNGFNARTYQTHIAYALANSNN